MSLKKIRMALWALVALAALGLVTLLLTSEQRPTQKMAQPNEAGNELDRDNNKPISTLTLEFNLIDQDGRRVTAKDYHGSYSLVFFGFTHCPDVCPTTLSSMASVLDRLGGKAANLHSLFISLDPKRDVPSSMKDYLSNFDMRIQGLSGEEGEITALSKRLGIFREVVQDEHSPDGYTLNHSASMLLFDKSGNFVQTFSYGELEDTIVATLEPMLN